MIPQTIRSARSWVSEVFFADLGDPKSAVGGPFSSAVESRSLLVSVRSTALLFAVLWQVVMVFVAFAGLGPAGGPLATALILVGVLALLARAWSRLDPLVPAGMAATGLWAYLADQDIDSSLVFAGCWQINFATCLAAILMLGRYGVPLIIAGSALLVAVAASAMPEWGADTFVSILATQVSIVIGVRWGMSRLVALAAEADMLATRSTRAEQQSRLAEHVSAKLAEETRVLHDTAINTLGAIANGSTGDVRAHHVVEQCHRDVNLLSALRERSDLASDDQLGAIFHQPWFPVRRRGLDDAALARWDRNLSTPALTSIVRIVREAVTNAAKHSGADHAVIDVTETGSTLRVTVSDGGRGFDAAAAEYGHGLANSIIGRARDHGLHASVESHPGEGTLVTVLVPADEDTTGPALTDDPDESNDADLSPQEPRTRLHHRSSELWAIGVTAVSVVLTAAGRSNHHLALLPMIALMTGAVIAYHFLPGFTHHRMATVFLGMTTVAVFLLSAEAVGFGSIGPMHWQALAPTGPFILLVALTPRWPARATAAAIWMAAIIGSALAALSYSSTAAQIVVIAGLVGLGFSGLWAMLQRFLTLQIGESEEAERDIQETLLRADLVNAAQKGKQRWTEAGLDSAISLLADIAHGARDPGSESTRRACGTEERHLRQLVQINPQLVNLSRALPLTLAFARDRDVSYFLQVGDMDTRDEAGADSIVTCIRDTLHALEPGAELRASLFPVGDDLQLTLVGASIAPPGHPFTQVKHRSLGPVELVEVTLPEGDTQGARLRPPTRSATTEQVRGGTS